MTSPRHPGSLLADTEMTKQRFMDLIILAAKL